ncbi:Beige/BEACH domain containing protein [Nitzschia inconspicua]|uniref:Beige/BEACH domain containing protein n=1 Tax=Nitzschia inconspicua TaxID=303405 RepID=A0A9K3LEM0_9STRA|nr:Beige/BEACH domain containing protein [Nitzschia inconspicua]
MNQSTTPAIPNDDGDSEISMSRHLSNQVSTWIDADASVETKLQKAKILEPFLQEIDGYLSFSSEEPAEGQWPVLEWNTHFRKAYTIILWVRPVVGAEKETTIAEDDQQHYSKTKRVLYRFATSLEDANSQGVCVSVGDWRAVEEEVKRGSEKVVLRKVLTTLTAYSLPHQTPELHMPPHHPLNDPSTGNTPQAVDNFDASAFVTASLELPENVWSMIGITHVFPYLKRPQWTICVNGRMISAGELPYPVLDKTPVMNFNTLFNNVLQGGCQLLKTQTDFTKKASELQTLIHPRHELRLHLASFLVSNEVFTPTIQALLAQAGPTMSLENGGCLPTLPPVANWTKGSSLEGPNVGIPLVVHGQALRVQQLSASCVLWGSAVESRLMGANRSLHNQQRVICRMLIQRGTTHSAPRVGLVQPTPPHTGTSNGARSGDVGPDAIAGESEDPVSLTVVGAGCSIHHNLSNYLLQSQDVANVDTQLFSTTKMFSLLMMQGQSLDAVLILPFFLALPPPGTELDLQLELLTQSLQHLYALFSNEAEFATRLIRIFSTSVRTGGGRWEEELLQNGSIHVLVSSLRQALVRAEFLHVSEYTSYSDFVKAQATAGGSNTSRQQVASNMTTPMANLPLTPAKVPESIVSAMVDLLDACCGPPSAFLEDLYPSLQIQRTSDLALTAVFGMALDWDLWGRDLKAASKMMEAFANRYGGECVTSGYILRSQVSVQFFLDTLKYKLQRLTNGTKARDEQHHKYLRHICISSADILLAMLLSSLSNPRSISQGEHDISACMGALSDCPLGSVGAHIVLRALLGVLKWCEIVPYMLGIGTESSEVLERDDKNVNSSSRKSRADDDHKCQVATRLARNLLMSQYHDVVAPMLLSRTVFSGERTLQVGASSNDMASLGSQSSGNMGMVSLSWQEDWKMGLLIFSWLSSIAGDEGVSAAKSLGSLLLASGSAGSLYGAMEGADELYVNNLFLPAPSMALTVASSTRKGEWSYTDLLSDRLETMMPVLPSLVVSLLSTSSEVAESKAVPQVSLEALTILADLLTSVGGAFYRVFGGMTHTAGASRGKGWLAVDNTAVNTAKAYVPPLLLVVVILEDHMEKLKCNREPDESTVTVLRAPVMAQKGADDGSWIEVSSTLNESHLSDGNVRLPAEGIDFSDANQVFRVLGLCQNSVLTTLSELMTNAMRAGGGEVSTTLWKSVLLTLEGWNAPQSAKDEKVNDTSRKNLLNSLVCRILAMVLMKCLNRDYQWELWTITMSDAISRLCLLVEEKDLLTFSLGNDKKFSRDQVLLICAFLDVLSYGRDTTGWCQLILPRPPVPSSGHDAALLHKQAGSQGAETAATAARVMLPVLQPSLRILLGCVGNIDSKATIIVPRAKEGDLEVIDGGQTFELLTYLVNELRHSIMAAVVGMSFANARDVALLAMATLRRALLIYENSNDSKAVELCTTLLCMTAEEIRVRYEGERRRRETALFDAYEEQDKQKATTVQDAAADSQAVENLILGGPIVPNSSRGQSTSEVNTIEEVCFEVDAAVQATASPKGDDFVLFHEGLSHGGGSNENQARMEWSQYEGLGAALGKCFDSDGTPIDQEGKDLKASANKVLENLSLFLDAWDNNAAIEVSDTELVKLFDVNLASAFTSEERSGILGNAVPYAIKDAKSAADAMSAFIEMAASEKSRMAEITGTFLPNHRYSSVAFAQRFCWARHTELTRNGTMNFIWERGIADGNRDIRSRLATIPCNPQFKRFIPKYLDHGADNDPDHDKRRSDMNESGDAIDIDEFTKTLIKTGHLEIIDITKKEITEEEELAMELPVQDTLDDDYVEASLDMPGTDDESSTSKKQDDFATEENSTAGSMTTGEEETEVFDKTKIGSSHFNITASAFASPPDNSSSTIGLMQSAAAGLIERHIENCIHVKAEGTRKCSMLLTATHLILEYDADSEGLYEGELMAVKEEADRQRMIEETGGGTVQDEAKIHEEMEKRQKEIAALRPKSIRWNLSELSHVYLRRYRLRDSSIELFFIPSGGTSFGGFGLFSPSTSLFLDFGPGYEGVSRRDDAAFSIMKRAPPQAIKQWPDRAGQFLHEQLSRLTIGWVEGRITNFDYLLHLNMLAGRSYNDTCQYPVFPWVLSNYESDDIPDLTNPENFRDLTKPMGALNPDRLEDFIERFNTFADPSIPPFMYGSHYSTNAGVVLHFLVRLHPFAGLHRQLQGGHFDVADRLFSSVPRTWQMCTGSSAAEVKELTPEWYCNPAFLKNTNKFKLGTSQEGDVLGDVILPPWAKGSPEKFVEVMRNALESDICSAMLPDWIDLIFGRKQQGPEAIAAHNVFFYLTYYGTVDVAAIEDEGLRQATELQIAHFGQCPMQLFVRPHVRRVQFVNKKRLSFYQIISAYAHGMDRKLATTVGKSQSGPSQAFNQPLYLPFFSAPMSHWVHLDAPPPGPHASLLSVRLAGTDRCLAVDAQGVFHCFRWAWKAEESGEVNGCSGETTFPMDNGCFIAQRELPRFRTVPRLVHKPRADETPAVAISKTLFAGRSVLLVLSDGDGRGGLAMQLVDPAKGTVRGEAVVKSVHSSHITCIATDPIGTAAGHGGVGGELAIVASSDGTASVWRFMSSHYLPLRPRVRMSGHGGSQIFSVGLSASIHVAVTVSKHRLCLHSIGNGNVIRIIEPPTDTLDFPEGSGEMVTTFATTPAVAISVQGFIVTVCESRFRANMSRSIITLHLFSLEGVSLGSKPLESWRGIPHKIVPTPDGTAVLVCSGRGITLHRISAITPLEFIDEWQITETDDLSSNIPTAYDIDLGPSLNRPVVAAAACSNGALRLHALAGISAFSERHKKIGISQSVGSLMAAPARRLKNALGKASAIGNKAAGVGKEISKEITTDVKERGVGGFIGGMFGKKK